MRISTRTRTTIVIAAALLLVAVGASAQNLDVKGTLMAEGLGGGYHVFKSSGIWRSLVVGGSGGTDVVVAGNSNNRAIVGAHNAALSAWSSLTLNGDWQGGGGNVLVPGNIGIGTANPSYKLDVAGDVHAAGWLRTEGAAGWYSQTYGGGWYMADSSWIRAYNNKGVWVDATLGSGTGLTVGYGGTSPSGGGAVIAGNVGIGTSSPAYKLDVRGAVAAGNSDIYFTNTAHSHTGLGNTSGYAAIENSSDYGTLMILGRSGTPQGRKVSVWDYLEVNGRIRATSGTPVYRSNCPTAILGGMTFDSQSVCCHEDSWGEVACDGPYPNTLVGRLVDP